MKPIEYHDAEKHYRSFGVDEEVEATSHLWSQSPNHVPNAPHEDEGENKLKSICRDLLSSTRTSWVEDEQIRAAQREGVSIDGNTPSNTFNEFRSKVREELDWVRQKRNTLHDAIEEAKQKMRAFQAKHGLTRPPLIDGFTKKMALAFGSIFIGETLFNGLMVSVVSTQGLLGGLGLALALSSINVGFGIKMGQVLPSLYTPKTNSRAKRSIGLGLLALGVSLALLANLLFAHIRGAVDYSTSLATFWAGGWLPSSLESAILLFVGMGIFSVAFYTGTSTKDPYQEYAKLGRLLRDSSEELTHLRDLVDGALRDRANSARDALQNHLDEKTNEVIHARQSLRESEAQGELYEINQSQILNLIATCAEMRRAKLKKSCDVGKTPTYWENSPVNFEALAHELPCFDKDNSLIDQLNSRLEALSQHTADTLPKIEAYLEDSHDQVLEIFEEKEPGAVLQIVA